MVMTYKLFIVLLIYGGALGAIPQQAMSPIKSKSREKKIDTNFFLQIWLWRIMSEAEKEITCGQKTGLNYY